MREKLVISEQSAIQLVDGSDLFSEQGWHPADASR